MFPKLSRKLHFCHVVTTQSLRKFSIHSQQCKLRQYMYRKTATHSRMVCVPNIMTAMCSSKIKQAKGKTHKSELAVLQWRRPGLPFKTTASIKLPTRLKRRKRANFFQLQLFETSKASRQPSKSVTEQRSERNTPVFFMHLDSTPLQSGTTGKLFG